MKPDITVDPKTIWIIDPLQRGDKEEESASIIGKIVTQWHNIFQVSNLYLSTKNIVDSFEEKGRTQVFKRDIEPIMVEAMKQGWVIILVLDSSTQVSNTLLVVYAKEIALKEGYTPRHLFSSST